MAATKPNRGSSSKARPAVPSGMWLEFGVAQSPTSSSYLWLRGEVNWLINGFCRERFPAIDLAHVDLSRGEQSPEQHGRGVRGRQHGLGLDPTLELLVQSLDGIGGACALPLTWR